MTRLRLVLALGVLGAVRAQDDPTPKLRDYLQRCARFGFAGSVLVARGGKVLLAEGFGLANREAKTGNTKDTLFEIASATKPFTAVAILQLEAQGKLSTDDPIAKHLPGVPHGMRDITIYHLLTHTSGMSRLAAGGGGDDLERAVAAYLSSPRARKAGAAYEYWNGGYALLAGIVERVSGGTFMDWCRQQIFAPAGMSSSGFTGDAMPAERVAIGYEGTESPRRADEHPYGSYDWGYRGMGGVVTSADDFYRFDRALRDDTLLPRKARVKLTQPFLDRYACGFYVQEKPRLEVSHGGDVRGFHTQFCRYPADDACLVILGNVGEIPMRAIAENLQALLFGDKSRYPQPPASESLPAAELAALAGTYELARGERIRVRVEDEAVNLDAEGVQATRALWVSPFGRPEEPDPELVRAAERVVASIAKGDAKPLRQRMDADIPSRWPDDVRDTLWPSLVRQRGALKSARVTGALAERGTTTVLLALEHEQGSARVKIIFHGQKLQILDLDGPESLASCRAVPAAKDQLLRFAWQGAQPDAIALVRAKDGRVVGLKVGDGTYRRVDK